MKAFTSIAFAFGLYVLAAGPRLVGDDPSDQGGRSGRGTHDFGQANLQREAVDLPLKLSEGKTYKWTIEARPHEHRGGSSSGSEGSDSSGGSSSGSDEQAGSSGGSGSHQGGSGSMRCKHEAEAKVTKVSGDSSTITFTYDASRCEFCKQQAQKEGRQSPGKVTYTVQANSKGDVTSFQSEGGSSGGPEKMWEGMLRTQVRQLLGDGLHNGRLEPGKGYDVAWMHPENWKMGSEGGQSGGSGRSSSSESGSSSASGGHGSSHMGHPSFELRFDGRSRIADQNIACFTIVPASGSFSSGETGGSPGTEGSSGSESGQGRESGGTSGRHGMGESGHSAFRLDDGLLDRFMFVLPASFMKEMHAGKESGSGSGGSTGGTSGGSSESSGMHGDLLITIHRTE